MIRGVWIYFVPRMCWLEMDGRKILIGCHSQRDFETGKQTKDYQEQGKRGATGTGGNKGSEMQHSRWSGK